MPSIGLNPLLRALWQHLLCAGNTVSESDADSFWSSTGSARRDAEDALRYRLCTDRGQPPYRLLYVSVAVYRAHYQHG